MRVLLIAHRYPPDGFGGVERYTQTLATELRERGEEVAIVARQQGAGLPELVRERLHDGATLYRIVGGTVSPSHFLSHHDRILQSFTHALVEFSPDVLHVNHLWGLVPDLIPVARRWGAAVVVSLHDFFFMCPLVHLQKQDGTLCEGPDGGRECASTCFQAEGDQATARWALRTAYFRRLLGTAHRIVTYSEFVASSFERYGAIRERIRIIPNGVSVDPDTPLSTLGEPVSETLRLAFCGAVVRHKGVHLIVEALEVAKVGPVNLLVLGATPDVTYLEDLRARASAVPGLKLEFGGPYDPKEMPDLLRGVQYVVVPSVVPEAGPIVPREALALGIPAIVSSAGALPEAIQDGESGLVFPAGRAGALAGILRRLSRHPSVGERLRQGARSTASWTVSSHASQIRMIYDEAMAAIGTAESLPDGDSAELAALLESLKALGFEGPGRPQDLSRRWRSESLV